MVHHLLITHKLLLSLRSDRRGDCKGLIETSSEKNCWTDSDKIGSELIQLLLSHQNVERLRNRVSPCTTNAGSLYSDILRKLAGNEGYTEETA